MIFAFLPGAGLYVASKLTRGELGIGDAYFLLISGCYLPCASVWLLLFFGVLDSGLWSIILMIYGKFRRISMRGRRIPLIPCMLPAICCIVSDPNLYGTI